VGKNAAKTGFLVAGGEHNQCRPSVAFAKGNYLVVWMGFVKNYGIYGARVSPDGKRQDNAPLALAVQGDVVQHVITPALDSSGEAVMLASVPIWTKQASSSLAVMAVDAAAAGPAGTTLLVYSEVRGADDTKVVARIVK
jgi:hypothetical protein